MKKTLMNVLRYIVKAIYPLVKAKRYVVKHVRALFLKSSKHNRSASPAAPVNNSGEARRYNPRSRVNASSSSGTSYRSAATNTRRRHNKKPLWKNKRLIAGACTFVVVVTIVLTVALPGANNNVYAGANAAYAVNASPTAKTSASITGEEVAPVNNSEEVSGFSGVLTNDIPQNTMGPGVSTMPTPDPTPIITTGPTPIPTTAPEDEKLLVPGCHDTRIIEIQERLMDLGYMESDEPTDFYGPITEYSIQLFQRKHDLKMDGTLDNKTLTKLFSGDAKPYSVKLGDRGTDVETIQDRLKELRYFKASPTGNFGPETEKAVKAFQKRNGLETDGSVGEITREALFSEDAKAAPKPAPKPTAKPTKKPSGSSDEPEKTKPPVEVGDPDKASAEALIALAKSLKGSKYVRGGKGPTKFDCPGFVYYCLNKVGRKTGYMTSTGWKNCSLPKISKLEDLKPGDIIVFKRRHVGIYIGGGKMIDASSGHGKVVERSCTTDYWRGQFACGRRVF